MSYLQTYLHYIFFVSDMATNQKVVIWPKINDNINKWDGEDEEDVKVH